MTRAAPPWGSRVTTPSALLMQVAHELWHNATQRAHWSVQTTLPDSCQFANSYVQHVDDELFLHNTLLTNKVRLTNGSVIIVHSNHIRAQNNPHDIQERRYHVRVSASTVGLVSSPTILGAPICYLIGRLINDIVIFRKLLCRST